MSNPLDNTDAEIRDHANTRVKELVNQMRGIRASMVTASAALVGFDAAGYSDMDGRVLMVRPEWTQLIEVRNWTIMMHMQFLLTYIARDSMSANGATYGRQPRLLMC